MDEVFLPAECLAPFGAPWSGSSSFPVFLFLLFSFHQTQQQPVAWRTAERNKESHRMKSRRSSAARRPAEPSTSRTQRNQHRGRGCACFRVSSPLCVKTFSFLWSRERREKSAECQRGAAELCASLPSECVLRVCVGSV